MIGLYDISIVVSRRGIMPAFSHLRHGSRQASGTKQKQPVSLKKRVSVARVPPAPSFQIPLSDALSILISVIGTVGKYLSPGRFDVWTHELANCVIPSLYIYYHFIYGYPHISTVDMSRYRVKFTLIGDLVMSEPKCTEKLTFHAFTVSLNTSHSIVNNAYR
jgi:hypothetical protein